jgi:FkbM family methyltransferase
MRAREQLWEAAKKHDTVTVKTRQGLLTVSTGDDMIGKGLFINGASQYALANKVLSFLRDKGRLPEKGEGVMIDAGAHVGHISIGMMLQGEFRKAVAIEADPENYRLLEKNVRQNGLEERFDTHWCALSDRDGTEELELSPVNYGDHRVRRENGAAAQQRENTRDTVSVPGKRLDSLIPEPDEVALFWMDVQGFEGHVFQGASNLISHDIPVNVEVWPYGVTRSGVKLEDYVRLVEENWSEFYCLEGGSYKGRPVKLFGDLVQDLYMRKSGRGFMDVLLLK